MPKQARGVRLKDYPYLSNHRYVINHEEQNLTLMSEIMGSRRGNVSMAVAGRSMQFTVTVNTVLFSVSSSCFFLASILSISKHNAGPARILNNTLAEIVFSLLAVAAMAAKQWLWLNSENKNGVEFQAFATPIQPLEVPSRHKRYLIYPPHLIITVHVFSALLVFFGFLMLLVFDDTDYTFLPYTCYFTILTLLVQLLHDYIVCLRLSERDAEIKVDKFRLLVHELRDELVTQYKELSDAQRLDEMEKFFEETELFALAEDGYIYSTNIVELRSGQQSQGDLRTLTSDINSGPPTVSRANSVLGPRTSVHIPAVVNSGANGTLGSGGVPTPRSIPGNLNASVARHNSFNGGMNGGVHLVGNNTNHREFIGQQL